MSPETPKGLRSTFEVSGDVFVSPETPKSLRSTFEVTGDIFMSPATPKGLRRPSYIRACNLKFWETFSQPLYLKAVTPEQGGRSRTQSGQVCILVGDIPTMKGN